MLLEQQTLKDEMDAFLSSHDERYRQALLKVPLFSGLQAPDYLSMAQKQRFIQVFYHIRGHFHDFLWYLITHAPNMRWKQLIIDNVLEESGCNKLSHEQLFYLFAKEYDVDIDKELVEQTHYLPFVKAFNQNHLKWLSSHDWSSCFSAYSAYERLDNIDYTVLYDLAKQLGTSKTGLIFFDIHRRVEHFEMTQPDLLAVWQEDTPKVKQAYQFIYHSQLNVWQQLSSYIGASV